MCNRFMTECIGHNEDGSPTLPPHGATCLSECDGSEHRLSHHMSLGSTFGFTFITGQTESDWYDRRHTFIIDTSLRRSLNSISSTKELEMVIVTVSLNG